MAITGLGQNTKAKIVKKVLYWRSKLKMQGNAYNIRRADRDISKPRTGTEARLERVSRSLVGTILYHETEQKSVRKDDMSRTDQDREDYEYFNCEIVRLGDRVIDDGCAKQDGEFIAAVRVLRIDHWESVRKSHQLFGQETASRDV